MDEQSLDSLRARVGQREDVGAMLRARLAQLEALPDSQATTESHHEPSQ